MSMTQQPDSTDIVARAGLATRGFFLVSGIATASWAPMVPFAKARLGLDDAELGGVLLCFGLGSTGAMPLAGWLSHRHGSRAVMAISGLVICAALPVLTVAPSALALAAALVMFGAALGVLDVAMNAHAVDVERRHGSPLMSGFHALFSLGGLAGSLGMTALLTTGAPLVGSAAAIAVVLLVVVATQRDRLLAGTGAGTTGPHTRLAMPPPAAVLLGGLCLIVMLAEGAMLDWSAVFLSSARDVAVAHAGLGYAAFSVAMVAGRLLGDRITAAVGPVRVVRFGSLLAAAGFVIATALPWAATSLAGFVLVGLGAANVVPVLFSAAGRLPGTRPALALATVTAIGYAGVLAGPAAIGFVADASSLAAALSGLAVLLAGVAVSAASAEPRKEPA